MTDGNGFVYARSNIWSDDSPDNCRLCFDQPASAVIGLPICATCARHVYQVMRLAFDGTPPDYMPSVLTRDRTRGHVYYVRRHDLIKIGFSANLPERMASLLPDEILAVEPGTFATERARHRQFAELRVDGEWFRDTEALRQHVAALVASHGSPPQLPTLASPTLA